MRLLISLNNIVVVSHFDLDGNDDLAWLNSWLLSYCQIAIKVERLDSGWTEGIDGKVC